MTFKSILFNCLENALTKATTAEPDFFVDLTLDQIIDAITASKQEYNLKPFFYTSLNNTNTIKYRQEIACDIENETFFGNIKSFAQKMSNVRLYHSSTDKLHYKYHEGWFLAAVENYCEAVNYLAHDLSEINLKSRGFLDFHRCHMGFYLCGHYWTCRNHFYDACTCTG